MSSVLMTSTMKSEPAGPRVRGMAGATPVAAAATAADGGSTAGRGTASVASVAEVAAFVLTGVTALAAPATATLARNLRRSTLAWLSLRDMCRSLSTDRAPLRRRCLENRGAFIALLGAGQFNKLRHRRCAPRMRVGYEVPRCGDH